MRDPGRFPIASLSVLVSVFVLLAPCQARAFMDEDVWVTSGIIAGITLGACIAIVLLAGVLTDLKGESDHAGTNGEDAIETALERLPSGIGCTAFPGRSGGLCSTDGGFRPTEAERRIRSALQEPRFVLDHLENVRPSVRPENLPGFSWLARSPEIPPAVPSVRVERSLFLQEDEARSGLPF